MRFSEENYLKAFPREEKPVKVVVAEDKPGNVIEEAEQIEQPETKKPDPVEDQAGDPEPEEGEGSDGVE